MKRALVFCLAAMVVFFTTPLAAASAASAAFAALVALDDRKPIQIIFFENSTKLPLRASTQLDPLLSAYHQQKERRRFVITAYGTLADKPSWSAFRLSLLRGLALRDYLTSNNVQAKDIVLLPQGNLCSTPCQRADIQLR